MGRRDRDDHDHDHHYQSPQNVRREPPKAVVSCGCRCGACGAGNHCHGSSCNIR